MSGRIIAHVDMDAFFAAVEERDKPYLRGLPIAIGADPMGGKGRGVVATANYKARAYGLRSALPIRAAWKLSEAARREGKPAVAFLTGSFRRYGQASRQIFSILARTSALLEQTSVDEGYLDLSHLKTYAKASAAMREAKVAIAREARLTASVGIAPNKMLAKIASEGGKPDGFVVIRPRDVDRILLPLSLRSIPGIGTQTEKRLRALGLTTVEQGRKLSWEELERRFGKWGFDLYERLRGIDERPVRGERVDPKSIGEHETLMEDTRSMKVVFSVLAREAESIIRTMQKEGFSGFRTAVLTMRFSDFTTLQRSVTVQRTLASKDDLELKAVKLALPFFDRRENPQKKAIRLIGLRIEKLVK